MPSDVTEREIEMATVAIETAQCGGKINHTARRMAVAALEAAAHVRDDEDDLGRLAKAAQDGYTSVIDGFETTGAEAWRAAARAVRDALQQSGASDSDKVERACRAYANIFWSVANASYGARDRRAMRAALEAIGVKL